MYGSSVKTAVTELPAEAAAAAENSIGAALQMASGLDTAGDALRIAPGNAFIDGMGVTFLVMAAITLIGGLFVFRFMPAHDVPAAELAAAGAPGGNLAAAAARGGE